MNQREVRTRSSTYNCGDEGAVEIGVSVRANPTPSLDACDFLWESECKSFPSALPATVFGGGIKVASFSDLGLPLDAVPFIVAEVRLRKWSGEEAHEMIAERAMSVCWAIPREWRREFATSMYYELGWWLKKTPPKKKEKLPAAGDPNDLSTVQCLRSCTHQAE